MSGIAEYITSEDAKVHVPETQNKPSPATIDLVREFAVAVPDPEHNRRQG